MADSERKKPKPLADSEREKSKPLADTERKSPKPLADSDARPVSIGPADLTTFDIESFMAFA